MKTYGDMILTVKSLRDTESFGFKGVGRKKIQQHRVQKTSVQMNWMFDRTGQTPEKKPQNSSVEQMILVSFCISTALKSHDSPRALRDSID